MTRALVLVDLQRDYLRAAGLRPAADAIVERAAALLDGCRRRGVPVVHVRTTIRRDDDRRLPHWRADGRWECVAGTEGHDAPGPVRAAPGEPVIDKAGFDGFADGSLPRTLATIGCSEVLVAGVHLHACVRAVVTGCLERQLAVTVAEDAVGSNDPMHAASTRRWLADRTVRFRSVHAILAAPEGASPPATLVHRSPRALDTILFDVQAAGAAEVADAAHRAQTAWRGWRQTRLEDRQAVLARFAALLDGSAPALAHRMASEIGKPVSHALEETRRAAASVRDVACRAGRHADGADGRGVRHQPLGAVALISPWNNPVAIPAGKIAPALVYGNTIVWKPAPAATAVAQAVLGLLREAGAPEHVVQLLPGDRATAWRLADHPAIDGVTFTGSELAGYDIQEICARRSVPLQAELGGNNAAIVWDDADLAHAAREVTWGAYGFAGQRCTATRRIIVSARRLERVWQALGDAARRLAWSDPLDPAADLGPVIGPEKRDVLRAQTEGAEALGAVRVERLFEDRAGEAWASSGAYVQPVLMACDRPEQAIVQEESMGPVLVVQPADDFDHALALLNGVRQGLAAALFSSRTDLQDRFLAEARAGILKLNASTAGVDVTLPFGGWKASGVGPPEHGIADRLFYTRMQAVYA